jgi:hypothetical protein
VAEQDDRERERTDDALWTARGPLPDDLAKLEADLAHLPLPAEPDWRKVARPPVRVEFRPMPLVWAAAAALVVVALAGQWLVRDAWHVEAIQGRATQRGPSVAGRLPVGGTCETDASSRVVVRVAELGEVELEPGTVLRRKAGKRGESRLELEHGTLHARILAPPRVFVVETRVGVATDLGCAYTLSVDRERNGRLHVTHGRVAFSDDGREAFVPAGVWCPLTPEGVGVPRREYASEAFLGLLAAYDSPLCSSGTLDSVLTAAEASDAISLWHMLPRVAGPDRERVARRLAALIDVPADVPLSQVLELDPAALDAWWAAIGMGSAREWRSGDSRKGVGKQPL